MNKDTHSHYVTWFRNSLPYIDLHRGKTFVIAFGGEALTDNHFATLVHDFALLNSLGIRLVLVHGARPQVDAKLKQAGAAIRHVDGLRATDTKALACVKEAVGHLRVEIESLFSMGLTNSPVARAAVRVACGNYITAKPVGVRNGVDYQFTGEVRRVDTEAIRQRLNEGNVVLLSPLGYSPSGEVFNLNAQDVAAAAAITLQADKLIFLSEEEPLKTTQREAITELTADETEALLNDGRRKLSEGQVRLLRNAIHACRQGVHRVHIIPRTTDGGLLLELFTRDGVGMLVSAQRYESLRQATIEDVGGVLELIEPLETDGTLVKRSRDRLETEIGQFTVIERDHVLIGCVALYPYRQDGCAEIACLAVHPDYRDAGRGDSLLQHVERNAKQLGIQNVFVLTTHTAHWFRERGFNTARVDDLPVARRKLYNYQRNSKIFWKKL
jgi:amino-acid N-acetyltransferase